MYEFRLPDLGEGIHEGEILKWYVRPGDLIEEDAPLVEVETDKAAVTIPSPKGGRIVEVRFKEGDIVKVGEVLVIIEAPSEETGQKVEETREKLHLVIPDQPEGGEPRRDQSRKVPAAPATRRLARELGVDISKVKGSGPGGRVLKEDVLAYVKAEKGVRDEVEAAIEIEGKVSSVPTSSIPYLDLEPLPDFSRFGEVVREPVRSIRRKVARNTVTAKILIPHVAHMDEADVTALEAFRRAEKARRPEGPPLTLLAFVVKAVTIALKGHPVFNATFDPFKDEIVYKKYYNIGIAVDTDRGLIVPNIKGADKLSVLEIAAQIEDLAKRARSGQIRLEDLQGGTFSITNIGVLGGTSFVPAIHYPESAILGMGRAAERPVVRDGQVVVRRILPLTLSFDHRIADGAEAARFVGHIRELLEEPLRLVVEG